METQNKNKNARIKDKNCFENKRIHWKIVLKWDQTEKPQKETGTNLKRR